MHCISKTIFLAMALGLFCTQAGIANAEKIPQDCNKFNEQVSMNVSFNGMADSAAQVQVKIDEIESNFMRLGKEIGMKEMKPNTQNFNLNNSQGGNGYNYNGYLSYKVKPYEIAVKFTDKLKEEGYRVNLMVNRSQFGNCAR